jgi:hypothetical protein
LRASKDLAKRLRFDRFPRSDLFRRWYFAAAVAAALAGLGMWVFFNGAWRARQYLPGPVSQNHATFGERCEKCHSPYKAVANTACLECHPARTHSEFEAKTPQCGDCHVEHRGVQVFLSVSNRTCIHCHGRLVSSRTPRPLIETAITSFTTHPQFAPLRDGRTDEAAVRFNHKLHLTSDKIAREQVGPSGKLQCADCHQVEARGAYMQPIVFEPHCKRCHEQKVSGPLGAIEAPHKTPEVVHDSLIAQLLAVAVQNPESIFKSRLSTLPGVADRPAISEARTLRAYQDEWLEKAETLLYKPFEEKRPLLDNNKYCFLCHLPDGERAAGELPKIKATKIPQRWLERGGFSHRRHDMLACKTCHEHVEQSEPTSDINLPKKELCLRCHIDGAHQSAGTDCMLCHLYHDTSKHLELRAAKRKEISLDALTGK